MISLIIKLTIPNNLHRQSLYPHTCQGMSSSLSPFSSPFYLHRRYCPPENQPPSSSFPIPPPPLRSSPPLPLARHMQPRRGMELGGKSRPVSIAGGALRRDPAVDATSAVPGRRDRRILPQPRLAPLPAHGESQHYMEPGCCSSDMKIQSNCGPLAMPSGTA